MASSTYAALSATAQEGFKPLPIQDFEVEVTAAEFKLNKSGNDMYKVEVGVVEGPHKGRKTWDYWSLTPSSPEAVGMFFAKFRSFGLDNDFFSSLPENPDDARATICQALIGRRAIMKTKHEPFNGQTTHKAASFKAVTGVPGVPTLPTAPVPETAAASPVAISSAPPDVPPGI